MNCVIDTLISNQLKNNRKVKLDVLRRYLKMRYRVTIDLSSLKRRADEVGIELAMA